MSTVRVNTNFIVTFRLPAKQQNVGYTRRYSVADPGLWSVGGGQETFCEFADGVKQSLVNEVSFR